MTDDEFANWASANGIDADAIAVILDWAAVPIEAKTVRSDCLYPPDDIRDLHESDGLGVTPQQAGFIFIGSCPSGDPIALDIADDSGSVWFVGHETMHSTPLREIAVRVADNLRSALNSITAEPDFPIDYYDAVRKRGG